MGWWQKAAQLPLSPPLTSWKIPAGQPAPDLGWPVALAHWLNPSWLSSFCVKLGLRRCDTVPSICRLVPALRHGDKSSIEETALGFEPLSQSSEPRKSPCPYFWAPSIGHGGVAHWGRQRTLQVAAFTTPPLLAQPTSWALGFSSQRAPPHNLP